MTQTEIQARIDAIDCALHRIGFGGSSAILAPNCADLQAQRAVHLAGLQSERASLMAQLPQPVTGSRWGAMVIAHTLGTVYVRETTSEYQLTAADEHAADPIWRAAEEFGWNLE